MVCEPCEPARHSMQLAGHSPVPGRQLAQVVLQQPLWLPVPSRLQRRAQAQALEPTAALLAGQDCAAAAGAPLRGALPHLCMDGGYPWIAAVNDTRRALQGHLTS